MIKREIQNSILADFKRKKVIVLLGARQVGKTTLLLSLQSDKERVLSLNCDNIDDRLLLEARTSTELKYLLSSYDMAFIDEAQRVKNIGLTLKMIGDLKLDTQIVVTGSSSFDMANEINEPATGRLIEYNLYPFSLAELAADTSEREEKRLLENRLIYGLYPEVVTEPADAKRTLMSLTNNYLYKDLFSYKGLKKPDVIQKLVRALALQLGSEVSYNELSNLLGIDKETVENYICLLEKCFVVFRLDSFSRNLRNEIKKGKKIYFYLKSFSLRLLISTIFSWSPPLSGWFFLVNRFIASFSSFVSLSEKSPMLILFLDPPSTLAFTPLLYPYSI